MNYLTPIFIATIILLLPLLAMQLTAAVVWNIADFVIAWLLLVGTGFTYQWIARKGSTTAYRVAAGLAIATALILVWINGAVGIIGNEGQPINLFYGVVLAVGFIGSLIARFKPCGMSRTLFTMALTQMLIPVIALNIPDISWGAAGVLGVFVLNAVFAILWIVSGLLFRRATRENDS